MALDCSLVLLQIMLLVWTIKASKPPMCQNLCGGFPVLYPFGIGEGCYFNKSFEVVCDHSSGSPKRLLKSINLVLSEYLTYSGSNPYVEVNISVISLKSGYNNNNAKGINLTGTPFSFSERDTRFTAVGCRNYTKLNQQNDSSGRCFSICTCDSTHSRDDCCDLSCRIPPNIKDFDANTSHNYSQGIPLQGCNSVTMVDDDWLFDNYGDNFFNLKDQEQVPVRLEWGKYKGDCYEAYDSHNKTCNEDNQCLIQLGKGYFCVCDDSSSNASKSLCAGSLICPTTGGYDCSKCRDGYYASNSTYSQEPQCSKNPLIFGRNSRDKFIVIGYTSGGLGMLLLVIGAWRLCKFVKRRREIKLKQKFFKKNGGLLLQQELSSRKGNIEKTKLFTSKELEKATNNFNMNRILGQGGQGTVYKEMLADGKIVVVKKSKIIDESKVKEFINEVVILSQINHRNVVNLLGCCLETEVLLLVYEFIPNGIVFQFIHDQDEEFPITWEMRLCIAVDVSSALSYLHSAASIPIYHRDIKSTNILLDDKYRAKVSDFGASRSMAVDQTHMTTQVQGTFGYLDPEYFRLSHFTEVLTELLTGENPTRLTSYEEDKSLAAFFLRAMKEDRLFEILDDHVLKEADKDEIVVVAKLAKRCLNLNGKKRPTMREVAMELAGIRGCNNGASNIVQESLEEIDCVEGDTAESSETDESFTIAMMLVL